MAVCVANHGLRGTLRGLTLEGIPKLNPAVSACPFIRLKRPSPFAPQGSFHFGVFKKEKMKSCQLIEGFLMNPSKLWTSLRIKGKLPNLRNLFSTLETFLLGSNKLKLV